MKNSAAHFLSTLLVIVAVASLSGCAEDSNNALADAIVKSPSASSMPSAATSAPESLSIEQLHQQYVASGLSCAWAVTENAMLGSIGSGRCSDSENGISTFATQAAVDKLLKLNADSIEPGIFLVGDRWVVASEHPQDLVTAQTTLGGQLWPEGSVLFSGK